MITQKELREAITEIEGKESPNLKTCYTLAALYIIQDHLEEEPAPGHPVSYDGESEFCRAIQGKDTTQFLQIIDGLMTKLQAVNPKLYDDTMRKINPGE